MLNAYSNGQTLAAGDVFPLQVPALVKGRTAVLSGNGTIQLNARGVYMVQATFYGLPAAAGDVVVSMTKDGVVQPQAVVTSPNGLTTTGVAVSLSTLVQVQHDNGSCCCSAPTLLQFINSGVGLSKAGASVVVTRIC